MMPQGATINCSLWVLFLPNCALRAFLPIVGDKVVGIGFPWAFTSNSSSMLGSSMRSDMFVFSVANASFGWASCARRKRSCSWNLACPRLMCTSSTALCSDRPHVFLPGLAARQQPTIAQTQLRCWWAGQKRSLLLSSGSLQFGWPQHGWPTVTPSITTAEIFLSIVHH